MTVESKLEICLAVPRPTQADEDQLAEAISAKDKRLVAAVSERFHPLLRPDFQWPPFVRLRQPWTDTANCAAAIVTYPVGSLSDLVRFLQGTEKRRESAIVIMEVVTDSATVITHPTTGGQVQVNPLPDETALRALDPLEQLDREFAEGALLHRDAGLPLFSISTGQEEPIHPLLVDGLGAPVVADWRPKGTDQFWYIVPHEPDWTSLVAWLVDRAIPTRVPDAAARVRGMSATEDRFVTQEERDRADDLSVFDEKTAVERQGLVDARDTARVRASRTRDRLLYEDGEELVDAVRSVLASCGFSLQDLDAEFKGGRSSDLLATFQGKHYLIEVKGKRGPAKEPDVARVVKHRTTWANLRSEPLEGCVLIVNHHRQLPTSHRTRAPYERPEFVQALRDFGVSVIGTVALCEWWADGECDAISKAITGPARQYGLGETPN
jgi:hypothetical protein